MKNRFKISYTRGSGPGGQRKNKVETCVVVRDPITGMKERSQDTPSRARNLDIAERRLLARIQKMMLEEVANEKNKIRAAQLEDRKAVRTYNFARNEVVDHRSGKRANLKKVLNGNLNLLK